MKIRTVFALVCMLLVGLSLMLGCSAIKQQRSFGPAGFTIKAGGYYDYSIPSINQGNTVNFNFSSSGALVTYYVYDPNNNTILTGNGGNKVASGAGSFIAASSGNYTIQFVSSGIISSSAITVSGTIK